MDIKKGEIKVAIKIIFHPIFALILFMTDIWMGSMMDPMYGIITILGGSLQGFSYFFKNGEAMKGKSKILFYGSFVFMLSLMSLAYLDIVAFIL